MARVERRFAIPGLIARAEARLSRATSRVIVANFSFLIVQGLLGFGNFVGGTLRLAIPAIVLGFVLGIFVGLARLARHRGSAYRPPSTSSSSAACRSSW